MTFLKGTGQLQLTAFCLISEVAWAAAVGSRLVLIKSVIKSKRSLPSCSALQLGTQLTHSASDLA
jgi:hypothetical protein